MPQYPHPREVEDAAQFRVYLFGPSRIYEHGERMPPNWIARRRGWDILVWFLLNPGRPAMAETLAEQLWPEDDPDRVTGSFHVSLHALRRALEPELGSREVSTFIRRHSNKVYSFEPGGKWWTDVSDLEQFHQIGHECELSGDWASACFYYRRVAGYVAQGQLLDGDTGNWLASYRRKYRQMCQQSLTRLMNIELHHGLEYDLVETAYLTLKIDRYNQLANRVVIESSLRSGRRPAAAQRLKNYCDALVSDLGVPIPNEIAELAGRVG